MLNKEALWHALFLALRGRGWRARPKGRTDREILSVFAAPGEGHVFLTTVNMRRDTFRQFCARRASRPGHPPEFASNATCSRETVVKARRIFKETLRIGRRDVLTRDESGGIRAFVDIAHRDVSCDEIAL